MFFQITVKTGLFKASGPTKNLFSLGVTGMVLLKDGMDTSKEVFVPNSMLWSKRDTVITNF